MNVMLSKQRYRIEWYRGSVRPENLVRDEKDGQTYTVFRAMDQAAARKFGEMRRPGLITVVTPVEEKE
jgi:hypothetical protein